MKGSEGLALIRGKWVEIDRERLQRTLEQFQEVERRAKAEGMTFAEAMRLLAGANVADGGAADKADLAGWSEVAAGPWLADTLKAMRQPEGRARTNPGKALKGTLRGVDHTELVAKAGHDLPLGKKSASSKRILSGSDLAALFGLDMAESAGAATEKASPAKGKSKAHAEAAPRKGAAKTKTVAPVVKSAERGRAAKGTARPPLGTAGGSSKKPTALAAVKKTDGCSEDESARQGGLRNSAVGGA